jgi:hypothetical protein
MLLLYIHQRYMSEIILPWLSVVLIIPPLVSTGKTAPPESSQGTVLSPRPHAAAAAADQLRICLSLWAPQSFLDYGGFREIVLPCSANYSKRLEGPWGHPKVSDRPLVPPQTKVTLYQHPSPFALLAVPTRHSCCVVNTIHLVLCQEIL